jgi:pimeloyl-ACP methyl ester carboxylesterase
MTVEATAPVLAEETVRIWDGELAIRVKSSGSGAPLVYLHRAAGLRWDHFLSQLATLRAVYAPEFPGTSTGDPYAVHAIDDISDLVLAYEEVIRRLGVERPVLIGHSFGGMLAAELAAHFPALPSRLVLVSPLGLWRPEAPVGNWLVTPPGDLFYQPSSEAAQAALAMPSDPQAAQSAGVAAVWASACAAKFAWPIPDRGLRARLHRIAAPTLIVWGRHDRVVPAVYADEFAAAIPSAKVAVIEDCGHFPQIEQFGATAEAITDFLS